MSSAVSRRSWPATGSAPRHSWSARPNPIRATPTSSTCSPTATAHLDRLDDAFENYGRALDLDPKHLGAHEYIGEAYLIVGDLAKAEGHLATLQDICASCEETEELAEAIEQFKEGAAAQ